MTINLTNAMKSLAMAMVVSLGLPSVAQASVTYTLEVLSGGARNGGATGNVSFTLDDFVKPVTRFGAGAGNIGGSEYAQVIPLASLTSCSFSDRVGAMPCREQTLFQSATSFTATAVPYDIFSFGIQMYPGEGTSGGGFFYFTNNTFQQVGVFDSILLPYERARLTITQDATSVPEPATWLLMMFGVGAVGLATRRSRKKILFV